MNEVLLTLILLSFGGLGILYALFVNIVMRWLALAFIKGIFKSAFAPETLTRGERLALWIVNNLPKNLKLTVPPESPREAF